MLESRQSKIAKNKKIIIGELIMQRNYEKVSVHLVMFEADDIVTSSVSDGIGVPFDTDKWGVTIEEVFSE